MTHIEIIHRPDWRTGISAGLIAGAIFLVMEMLLVALVGGDSPWAPPRMMAAIALGKAVLPPPATFDIAIVLTGVAVHFVLSIILGLVFVALADHVLLGTAWRSEPLILVVGAVFGLAIYVVDFYGLTAIFPWFAMARNWISILSHAVFGVVLAASYGMLARR